MRIWAACSEAAERKIEAARDALGNMQERDPVQPLKQRISGLAVGFLEQAVMAYSVVLERRLLHWR